MGLRRAMERDGVLRDLLNLATRNRSLVLEMAKREIKDRYVQQVLGAFWAVFHPVVIVGVYMFIFMVVFKVKLEATGRSVMYDYSTYILSGLIPWLAMQEVMSKTCTVITSNVSLVKQVIFPIEVLPIKTTVATEVTQLVMFFLLTAYLAVTGRICSWMFLTVPVLVFLQFLLMCGIGMVLSVVGAYIRDTKDVIQVFSVTGIYVMPIFYLPAAVPGLFRPFLYLNPVSYMVWCYQDAICFGGFVHWWAWLAFAAMSAFMLLCGMFLFRKAKAVMGSLL